MTAPLSPSSANSSADKLSPQRAMSAEQQALIRETVQFCEARYRDGNAVLVIQGDAGTGKSLVLNAAFTAIQKLARQDKASVLAGSHNVLLVNHPEMIKLYRNISVSEPALRRKDYERPTTFINAMHKEGGKADIVFIDEAHLLLTRSDRYNRFQQDNQLEEILKLARIVVLVFDPRQTLKFKGYWDEDRLCALLEARHTQVFTLSGQFRVQADPDVMTWIRAFCSGTLLPLPARQAFDFRIFDDAQAMYEAICEKNRQWGLCRILATYDYPYTLNGADHFVTAGRFRLRWDRSQPGHRLPWAERDDSIDEVGSVYTVQGFDLNYAGVLLGPSVGYDRASDRIILRPERYEDRAAFNGRDGVPDPEAAMRHVMFNALFVLFTRGIHGLYLCATDPALRERLDELKAQR